LSTTLYPDFQGSHLYEELCDELWSRGNISNHNKPCSSSEGLSPDPLDKQHPPPTSAPVSSPPSSPLPHTPPTMGGRGGGGLGRIEKVNRVVVSDAKGCEGRVGMTPGQGDSSPGLVSPPILGTPCPSLSHSSIPSVDKAIGAEVGLELAQNPSEAGAHATADFESLWRCSQGNILERMLRRMTLPGHVSKHLPPLERGGRGGGGIGLRQMGVGNGMVMGRGGTVGGDMGDLGSGCGGAGGLGVWQRRSGSGIFSSPGSPGAREHILLPRSIRRLGRKPCSMSCSSSSSRSSRCSTSSSSLIGPVQTQTSSTPPLGSPEGRSSLSSPPLLKPLIHHGSSGTLVVEERVSRDDGMKLDETSEVVVGGSLGRDRGRSGGDLSSISSDG
ncbi:unnamed protein product, partial [Choristocarpus tenellus]